jgi:hypothetical protein
VFGKALLKGEGEVGADKTGSAGDEDLFGHGGGK